MMCLFQNKSHICYHKLYKLNYNHRFQGCNHIIELIYSRLYQLDKEDMILNQNKFSKSISILNK